MLDSIFSTTSSSVELAPILLASLVAIFLGVFIAVVYKKTTKYSKNFLITLSILPLLVEIVIIMVNGNLGTSVAIVGAFSLVRFRSIPGTSKEIICVFFAMSIGLILGMGYVVFAIIMTVLIALVLLLFHYIKLFDKNSLEKTLRITMPEDLDYSEVFNDVFEKYLTSYSLFQIKTINMGSMFDLSYRITLKKEVSEKAFIDDLRIKNGNLKIILTHDLIETDL